MNIALFLPKHSKFKSILGALCANEVSRSITIGEFIRVLRGEEELTSLNSRPHAKN